jgi:carboxyl-terminal processing protease
VKRAHAPDAHPMREPRRSGRRRAGAVAAGLLLLAGCGGASSSPTSPSGTTCAVADENAQVFSILQSWYYWYQSLPATVNTAAYATPAALLDAVRQQPLDRFSFVTTQAADQAYYAAGQYVGFGVGFALTAANELQVTRVFPGSPAAGIGLGRGDTVTALNGVAVPALYAANQLASVLSVSGTGTSLTAAWTGLDGQEHSAAMVSAVVTEPSVALVKALPLAGRAVGYIVFNSFITPSPSELDQAFAQLSAQGIRDLVIDERYNGGGDLSVAQHLASLVAGPAEAGALLGTLTFNDKHSDQNQDLTFPVVSGGLGLERVYFITTPDTASASEFVINALAPYLQVVVVGSATFGKPVGENGFDVCADVLYPITFQIANSKGYAGYFDGLPPDCPAVDDLAHALGDPEETSLATALGHVETGSCGAATAAAARENARQEAAHPRAARRYGFRELVGAY